MGGISILMSTDLSRPWADLVVATDASTTGVGVVEAAARVPDVAAAGRWRERQRFRGLDPAERAPCRRTLDGLDEISLPYTAWENACRMEGALGVPRGRG